MTYKLDSSVMHTVCSAVTLTEGFQKFPSYLTLEEATDLQCITEHIRYAEFDNNQLEHKRAGKSSHKSRRTAHVEEEKQG